MHMTLRNIAIAFALGTATVTFVGCNSDPDEIENISASAAAVRSFSLSENDKVLDNLDSVFFSIDLVKGAIFNADSLPEGTNVTKLVPVITWLDGASIAELKVSRAQKGDTTYNYLKNSTDSIDFTNPVVLRMVSADGMVERNYTIKVNVHKVKSDSLAWNEDARTALPSCLAVPVAQRTVRSGEVFYCLTRDASRWSVASHDGELAGLNGDVAAPRWTEYSVSLPAGADINSFTATDDALYVLADGGMLWRSTDGARSWTSTGRKYHALYGGYGTELIGSVHDASGWKSVAYPSGASSVIPADMPVDGASVPVSYTFPMSDKPQMMIVGGRRADNTLTGHTWGYDGSSWACVSRRAIPVGLSGIAVARYYLSGAKPMLIAMGGRDADGKPTAGVYISDDYGFNWRKAPVAMQLPAAVGVFADAQAYVSVSKFTSAIPVPSSAMRISRPAESWECPYIYLFGGDGADGRLRDAVWRGVINNMTFRPIE